MYTTFIFKDGSNPYITKTNKELFKMLTKNYCEQIGTNTFEVLAPAQTLTVKKGCTTYKITQDVVRNLANEYQYSFNNLNYSYYDLIGWQNFFEEYGKRYGLIKEFKENGII